MTEGVRSPTLGCQVGTHKVRIDRKANWPAFFLARVKRGLDDIQSSFHCAWGCICMAVQNPYSSLLASRNGPQGRGWAASRTGPLERVWAGKQNGSPGERVGGKQNGSPGERVGW